MIRPLSTVIINYFLICLWIFPESEFHNFVPSSEWQKTLWLALAADLPTNSKCVIINCYHHDCIRIKCNVTHKGWPIFTDTDTNRIGSSRMNGNRPRHSVSDVFASCQWISDISTVNRLMNDIIRWEEISLHLHHTHSWIEFECFHSLNFLSLSLVCVSRNEKTPSNTSSIPQRSVSFIQEKPKIQKN